MVLYVLDEEPDDDLDCYESEEHKELEAALFASTDHVETGYVLARAEAAWRAGRLTEEAFRVLLAASGQEEFWNRFLL